MTDPEAKPRSRGWKLGCIGAFGCVGCGGGIAALVAGVLFFFVGTVRSTDAYRVSFDEARAHPEVRAALGQPIERGWWMTGQVSINNDDGEADLSYPISGPSGSGKVRVRASRKDGVWSYEVLECTLGDKRVDLLPLETSAGPTPK
jgi:hypothetical protein